MITEFEELPMDGPLRAWIDQGLVELLPGCEPPIPEDMAFWEAMISGFICLTAAGLALVDRRAEVLSSELGIARFPRETGCSITRLPRVPAGD